MADPPDRNRSSRPPFTVLDGGARSVPPSSPPPPADLTSGAERCDSPRRDRRVIAGLFEVHNPYVLKRLFRYGVRNPADLEEQAMCVWVIVTKKYADFRGEAAVTTWLSGICRKVASDFRRAAWQRRAALSPDGTLPEPEPTDAELEQIVGVIDALTLLNELPSAQRDVFVLYYIEDRTASTIAAELGIADPRRVYTLIEKALAALAELTHRIKETP